ncbi:hypothetical protein [Phyllobacterium sp. OV277]|uniref:hypothetical protein n=1 Tax=Phyllobacterium sp. OV277 TaxID=1882772 RepID=UPI00088C4CF3|nr:hypothetical protein [Phyllobacterium sp. OV277]SDO58601.1 hypothetical protein SAMN05443582_102559 [Phyllobacterium sp. OV277]
MSIDINVYTNEISDDLIPAILEELNKFGMICEFPPDFSLESQSGFLPIRFRVPSSTFENMRDKDLVSGFELSVDDNELDEDDGHSEEDQKKLKTYRKLVSFYFTGASDSFELRFASLTSAIIATLTHGALSDCDCKVLYDGASIMEAARDLIAGDSDLTWRELEYHEFEGWD